MRRTVLVALALLSSGLARAEGVSDAQLRKAVRRAAPEELAALSAAEEAHDQALGAVEVAQDHLHATNMGARAAQARVEAAQAQLVAIAAERAWAEAAGERGRLADLFAEERMVERHAAWRAALVTVARARQFHDNRVLELAFADREVREGVLELVRMRTYVELKGDDEALAAQIGALQAALGRAEVTRHDAEQAVAQAAAAVAQAELEAARLAP